MNKRRFGLTRSNGKITRMTYYAVRGRVARDCYVCDRKRCKCDRVQMRKMKRGARHQWRREIAREVAER